VILLFFGGFWGGQVTDVASLLIKHVSVSPDWWCAGVISYPFEGSAVLGCQSAYHTWGRYNKRQRVSR
jgi:hypothetical protein